MNGIDAMRLIPRTWPLAITALLIPLGAVENAVGQTPVRVSEVRQERLQQRHAVTGSLRAVSRGDVAALESGRLESLTVREGDTVKAGDVIAEIDSRRLTTQLAGANADLRVAEAELKRHRAISKRAFADLARSEKLIRENAISRQELDGYRAAADIAEAEIESALRQIERAKESVHLLEVRLSDTHVIAPYDASVVARHIEPGDWVQPGDALVTLVSVGPIEAWLEVPERFASQIPNGNDVAVQSGPGEQSLQVLSTKRIADVNPRVRTVKFVVTVENPNDALAAGMSVRGWVPTGRRQEVLTVPKDAIVRRSGQPTVFTIADSNRAEQVPVRVLFETADRVAVSSPELSPQSVVVTEGNERLTPQQLVRVLPSESVKTSQIASR